MQSRRNVLLFASADAMGQQPNARGSPYKSLAHGYGAVIREVAGSERPLGDAVWERSDLGALAERLGQHRISVKDFNAEAGPRIDVVIGSYGEGRARAERMPPATSAPVHCPVISSRARVRPSVVQF
jgi:hypothetical protein